MTAPLPRPRRETVRRRLIAWYRHSHRDLPWRRTDDPYRIWLSETMLQQTRVETVIPYYERFLEHFPTLESLAAADEQDVLRDWAGLGYYARARNLKRAAEQVVRDHGGELPRDPEALAALPGVGRYTLGALRSIAFKEPTAAVDGNVTRVLARLTAARRPAARALEKLAAELVPASAPDLFNQALMELGATVCTPRSPRCLICPLRGVCAAAASGRPEDYPAPRRRRPPVPVRALGGVLRRGRPPRVLMLQRPSRGLLGGLWEIPSVAGESADALVEALLARTGLRARPGQPLGRVSHGFSHRLLDLSIVELEPCGGRLRASARPQARFCTPEQIARLPLSALVRRALAASGVRAVRSEERSA